MQQCCKKIQAMILQVKVEGFGSVVTEGIEGLYVPGSDRAIRMVEEKGSESTKAVPLLC